MKSTNLNRGERGIALLFVLFALLLLTAIAAGLMFLTSTETSINTNYRSAQQSYFASRAGLEEVRDRLRVPDPNTLSAVLPGDMPLPALPTMPGGINGVVYVINQGNDPTPVTPWNIASTYGDDQLCHDYTGVLGMNVAAPGVRCDTLPVAPTWYRNPPPVSTGPNACPTTAQCANPGAAALPYKWMRVTWKANQSANGNFAVDGTAPGSLTAMRPVCWDGARERMMPLGFAACQAMTPAMVPVYMITSLAVTPSGARRMTQAEVAKNIIRIPSALTLDGDKARTTFGTPDSANFGIDGTDACTGAVLPAIGTVSGQDDTGVTGELFRPTNYTGEGGAPSVIDLNTPADPPRLSNLTTVADLKKLVADITAAADQIVKMPAATPNLGDPANPATAKVTVINGDFTGPCDGQGVLLITGNATCGGDTKFEGLMLIIGKGNIQVNGGGNGYVNGAMFIANLFDNAGKPLPDSSKPGVPTFDWNGGGTNFIQFDSCKILNALNKSPYRLLAMREVTY